MNTELGVWNYLPAVGTPMFSRLNAEHDVTISEDCRHGINCASTRYDQTLACNKRDTITHPLRKVPSQGESCADGSRHVHSKASCPFGRDPERLSQNRPNASLNLPACTYSLNLITNQQNVVFLAELKALRKITLWRDDNTVIDR